MSSSLPSLSQVDFDAIEAAVMETARGRWFLSEYARRHRHADTQMLLDAMARLENVVRTESVSSVDRLRAGLSDMSAAIARTKADIAALKPEGESGRIEEATEELDSVVSATETATGDILAAAEQIQEIAWTLRERPLDASHCDMLDSLATDIYTACSFQDLTGQRTRKVINVLRYLESRIAAMIDLWGRPETSGEQPVTGTSDERALLNGPARPGQGLDQSDIDFMMDGLLQSAPLPEVAVHPEPEGEWIAPVSRTAPVLDGDVVWVSGEEDLEAVTDEAASAAEEPAWDIDLTPAPATAPSVEEAMPHAGAAEAADPLAPLNSLSREEKIALFS